MNNKSFLKFSINLIIRLFFFDICCITALFIGTEELAALLYHVAAAFRATLSRWLLPGHEITLRIILTAVITSSLLGLLDNNIFSALRTPLHRQRAAPLPRRGPACGIGPGRRPGRSWPAPWKTRTKTAGPALRQPCHGRRR